MKKKRFSIWRMEGKPEEQCVFPTATVSIYSSLRQGWVRVWTSISTAEWFPKKTTDKNIIWIISEEFQLYKKFLKLWEL